jgi:DNA-binding MarR family transcriptional regulator
MEEPISKDQYENLATFRYALRQFLRFSEEAVLAVGLTPQQHQALLAIKGFPGRETVTIGELAERLQIKHHSAVGLVDRLVSQSLVMRQPATDDRRQVFLCITPHGTRLLERLTVAHKTELRRVGPILKQLLEHLAGENPALE